MVAKETEESLLIQKKFESLSCLKSQQGKAFQKELFNLWSNLVICFKAS